MRSVGIFIASIIPLALSAIDGTPQGPVVPVSATRSEIVLNGSWLFQPTTEASSQPGPDWGTIEVPGSWFPQRDSMPGILQRGNGEMWSSIGESTSSAWYQRQIAIPADWAGKEISVDFDRVSTDATVFLDGNEVGKLEWPGGTVDLTKGAHPGSTQTLSLHVTASSDAVNLDYMGIGQNTSQKAKLDTRGITGDVVLSSRPRGSSISGIFIQPSVREKKLKIGVDWSGTPPAGTVTLEIAAKEWPGGGESKHWSAELPPGSDSVTLDWHDPKLWDYKQPNLYTLTVSAKGAGVDDEVSERFGFCEWRVDGRTLLLNEIPFRPQPVNLEDGSGNPRLAAAFLDLQLSRGIGIGWQWPSAFFQRGKTFYQENLAAAADEKGFPMMGNLYRLNEFVNDQNFNIVWPQNKERWEKLTREEWKKFRNHPSIAGWILSGNLGPKFADQDPRKIGRAAWQPNETTGIQLEARDFMRSLDPGRLVLFGAATWPGDIYSAMTYLNFIPLQEREEWLSEWATSGTMPFLAIEFGTPLQNSYMRGRNHFGPSGQTEPWMTEFAAIYLGPDAYKQESQNYRRKIRSNYLGGNRFQSFNFEAAMLADPVYQAIQELFIRNTWRSWRTLNAGWVGMLSWGDAFNLAPGRSTDVLNLLQEFQPGRRGVFPPAAKTFQQATTYQDEKFFTIRPGGSQLLTQGRPTMAWIAGPADAFTSKVHNFRGGQTLKKQVGLVNDSRGALSYEGDWTVSVGGKPAGSGEVKGTISPGTSQLLPFQVTLPAVDNVSDGEVQLNVRVGETQHSDKFAFQVFPAVSQPPPVKSPVLVADPLGGTSAWLGSVGVPVKPWDGKPVPGAVLVVGRQALSDSQAKGPTLAALEAFVAAGGRLLIMSQDADWLRTNLGFRVTRHSTRLMWPVQGNHPVMSGIPAESLHDWAGNSTMQENKPIYPDKEFPPFGWRWGQRGVLGASVIEKPHFTGWRPIFESEFDLQYAPLMELDFGKGRVTWCSLDLEDQSAADPAAEKLSRNLLAYVATAPLIPRVAKTVYVGGEAGAKFLASLGLIFEQKPTLDSSAQLTILAPDSSLTPQALWGYVERGGKVFFLGYPQGGADYFGAKTILAKNFSGSAPPPNLPEFAGLSASDLRLKTDMDWRVLSPDGLPGFQSLAGGMLGLRKEGRGEAVWAQLGPDLLQGEKKDLPEYLRFTRWRQCRAISQILANLGATFQADARVFRPRVERISLAGPWRVQMTSPLPVVEGNSKYPDTGISETAKSLVASPGEGNGEAFDLPAWYPPFEKNSGEAVWKRDVILPAEWAGKFVQINIPAIKSYDTVYWNGQPVGSTSKDSQKEDPWNLPRKYRVQGDLVKAGKNTIAIRQFAPDRQGGIHGRALDFNLRVLTGEKQESPLYYPDYREDFETGDEPYRYIRW